MEVIRNIDGKVVCKVDWKQQKVEIVHKNCKTTLCLGETLFNKVENIKIK